MTTEDPVRVASKSLCGARHSYGFARAVLLSWGGEEREYFKQSAGEIVVLEVEVGKATMGQGN